MSIVHAHKLPTVVYGHWHMITYNDSVPTYPIVGTDRSGKRVWYTGKAGDGFISHNPKDAFMGYSLEGARHRAKILNRMTGLHGVYFVACVGDLLKEVRA